MKIPEKISPNPIIDFVIDIKFLPKQPPDAVFGLIYNLIQSKFGNIVKLPILQVPDEIRNKDQNLLYQPYYRLTNDQFVLQIGPRILALSAPKYPGWDIVINEAMNIFQAINKIQLFDKINRIGIRYVNFFKENIFENSELSLIMKGKNLSSEKTFFRTEITNNNYKSLIQISNSANINNKLGSVIDIDTSLSDIKSNEDIISQIDSFLSEGHELCKELFFGLIKEDYLLQFNPKYDK
ncbi:CHP04255 [Desulfonema limicola]|uniref:CHP04255 n=1 Tax=Desulfonema limicola TaxID=45656 RepID=A0A975B5C3_9BACT|nr:TIGR04255 family protein [Desulfonema limicola]QTA79029.1 CHP04255 [Desulfonema limicola]